MNFRKFMIHLALELLLWTAGLDELGDVAEFCQHPPLKFGVQLEQVFY